MVFEFIGTDQIKDSTFMLRIRLNFVIPWKFFLSFTFFFLLSMFHQKSNIDLIQYGKQTFTCLHEHEKFFSIRHVMNSKKKTFKLKSNCIFHMGSHICAVNIPFRSFHFNLMC